MNCKIVNDSGTSFRDKKICPSCKNSCEMWNKYCSNCGRPLTKPEPQTRAEGRNMKLHEFKAALESDATIKAAEQEKTIKKLHGKINSLEQTIEDKNHSMQQLMSRCFAQTRGGICVFCGFKEECGALKSAIERRKKEREG